MSAGEIEHALIMAAGRGVRMRPLTDSIPKAMAPHQGSTLIARGLDELRPELRSISVTVGYKGAMLAEHVITHGASAVFSTEGRGNAWWLFNTPMTRFDEPILVLTCDNVMRVDLDTLNRDYRECGSPPCMVVAVRPVDGLEGDYIHHERRVVSRLSRLEPAPTYCSGIQVVNPAAVRRLVGEADSFDELWPALIGQGALMTSEPYPFPWYSVDTLEQLLGASAPTGPERAREAP